MLEENGEFSASRLKRYWHLALLSERRCMADAIAMRAIPEEYFRQLPEKCKVTFTDDAIIVE